MKQEYKELMLKFLDNHPDIEVTSNPIGWYRDLVYIGDDEVNNRTTTGYDIRHGKIETAMISLFVKDAIRNDYTSYKVKYNKEEKAFKGKVKRRYDNKRHIDVKLDVPEDVWFDTMDVRIDVKSKINVESRITFNVRNGMFPPNIEEIRKQMEHNISGQVMGQLKGEGRVSPWTHMQTNIRYNKDVHTSFNSNIITHNQENVTINI